MMDILYNAVRTAGIGGLAFVGIYLSAEIGSLDGEHQPVMIDHVVEKEIPALDPNKVEITMRFVKVRDCKIVSQDFYIKDKDDVWTAVSWETPATPTRITNRPLGALRVVWVLGYPPSKISHKLRRVLRHHCWGPGLWETVTDVTIPARAPSKGELP